MKRKPPIQCLAAVRDNRLDDRIPEHHAELVKRGLRGDPALMEAARKFRLSGMRLGKWGDQ